MADVKQEKDYGKFTLPPPQWAVIDAHGGVAKVGAWTELAAYRAGDRLLTEAYERLAPRPLTVSPWADPFKEA